MTTNQSPKDIERLLAEADEIVQRINSDVLNEIDKILLSGTKFDYSILYG